MAPAYDPIRDMGSDPGASASPPAASPASQMHRSPSDELGVPRSSRLPSRDDAEPSTRAGPNGRMRTGHEAHQIVAAEEMAGAQHREKMYEYGHARPSNAVGVVRQSPLQQPQAHAQQFQQHPYHPQHLHHHQSQHMASHHHHQHGAHPVLPQPQHRPSSSSSSSDMHYADVQQQHEPRRSASIHDLITASEIVSAGQQAASAGPTASPSLRAMGPSRSLSHHGDELHDYPSPHRHPGASMGRSASSSSQPLPPHRQSSQGQLYAHAPARTERSPSMANLLNDGTAGAVSDRPRSGSQSSISSMLSHSHSHPQLQPGTPASMMQHPHPPHVHHSTAAASAPPAPPSAYSHPQSGHEVPARDAAAHLQSRHGSSVSGSWVQSPPMGAPAMTAAPRTNSSPGMGPLHVSIGSDRQRIFSHPGLVTANHPRSLSASYGHAGNVSVTSSPSGPLPLALHASPSHQFAVPGLPAHRSPEGRRIPLPPSPSSGPFIPGRGPTTPGSVWPSAAGASLGPLSGEDLHLHHSAAAHLAASPRRGSFVQPLGSRFQPPTPGGGIPHTPGSLPLTPGGLPPTPGSRSLPPVTPGVDPRYSEEYFPKRHSEAMEAYGRYGHPQTLGQASPAGMPHLEEQGPFGNPRRSSSVSARHPSMEGSRAREPPNLIPASSPSLEVSRTFAGAPPSPQTAMLPSSHGATQLRMEPRSHQQREGERHSMFDPVRGTAVPVSRPTSSSSLNEEASPKDPRRYSESSIGARSSNAEMSPPHRKMSMEVLSGAPGSLPSPAASMGKRRPSAYENEVYLERDGKKPRLTSDEQPNESTLPEALETNVAAFESGAVSPRTGVNADLEPGAQLEREPEHAAVSLVKAEPEPASSADSQEIARSQKGPEAASDIEMQIATRRPSPPRFTPPPEEEQVGLGGAKQHRGEPAADRPTDEASPPRSTPPPPAPPPLRYAPKKRVSPPKSVLRPIGIDEIDRKRSQCRNFLRREWERDHRMDSREPLDEILRKYHEGLSEPPNANGSNGVQAPVGQDGQSESGRKRGKEDDLKDADEVADHYNKRREVGVHGREESRIIALRKFNNWVKSVLIGRFTRGRDPSLDGRARPRGGRVMELGCGKGGDLKKWDKVDPASLIGVDIAQISIEQAIQRHRDNRSRFEAHFYAFDCFSRPLTEVVPKELLQDGIDTVSLQFCMHYAWENVNKARIMLENVSRYLRRGGTFIGTIPDSEVLRNRLYKSDASSFGNHHYRVTFDQPNTAFTPFGSRYFFFLEDAVENVPEYVVDWPTFESLAFEYGLKCVYERNFAEIYNDDGRGGRRNKTEFGMLAERMKVVDAYRGELMMTDELWEAVTLYKGFAFEKVR